MEPPKKYYKESTTLKGSSLKKIKQIDKSLAKLTKMKREKTQISKIRNAKMDDNNKHQGNPGNYQRLLREPIFQ
jgi:hypothetical protein